MTRSRLAGDPPDLTVAPKLGHVGLLEFERAAEAIAEGEAATERIIPEIHSALRLLG
jgi:NTE family protein